MDSNMDSNIQLDQDLKNKITAVTARQQNMINEMKEAKGNVDIVLNKCIDEMMDDDDVINDEGYKEYFKKNRPQSTTINAELKEDWINSIEDRRDRIKLASEYSREGNDGWRKKAEEAEDFKKDTKRELEDIGEKILERLEELKKEFNVTIEEIELKIKEKEKSINEIENNLLKAKRNKNGEEIARFDNMLENKKADKKELKEKLENLIKQKDIYYAEVDNAKHEFSKGLSKEANIKIGIYAKKDKNEVKDKTSQNSQNINNNGGNREPQVDKRKPKEIAHAETIDFNNAAVSEIMDMIDNSGFEYLLNLSREVGHFDRKDVREGMQNRLDDMFEGVDVIKIGETEITKKQLKNLHSIDKDTLGIIVKEVNKFAKDYDKMKRYEQREADKIMQYLKIAVLLAESKNSKPNRFFINKFTNKKSRKSRRITEIGNELRKLAEKTEKKADYRLEIRTTLHEKYGFNPPAIEPQKNKFKSNGNKPIQEQGRGM